MDVLNFLSDIERAKIAEKLNSDEVLVNAIKKVLLWGVYGQGVLEKDKAPMPMKNAALGLVGQTQNGVISNEDLGADLRALFEGAKMVEMGFGKLAEIKSKQEGDEPVGNIAI